MFLTISQNSWENICARASFLIKFIEKETLAQVFSCAFCEIFKSTFFTEHLPGTASLSLSLSLSVCVCLFVRVCVCVCVFILFYREGFFRLQDVWDTREGYRSAMLCFEYHTRCFCQVPPSPYLKMSYFSSKDETPKKKPYVIFGWRNDDMFWYRI